MEEQQPYLPPPMPPAPVVKKTSARTLWLIGAGVVVTLGLIGNALDTQKPAAVAAPNDPVVIATEDCADLDAFIDARDSSIAASDDAADSFRSYDVAGASADLGRAALYTSEMSDIALPGNATESAHLANASDALQQASDLVSRGQINQAIGYVTTATDEMDLAVASEHDSQWC